MDAWLRVYWWPLLALAVGTPLAVAAVLASLTWVGKPFPGFLLMRNAVIPTVGTLDWPPNREQFFHASVVEIDGRPVQTSSDVYAAVAARPAGTAFRYQLQKSGQSFQVVVRSMPFTWRDYLQTYGVLLLFGCSWLAFGLVVAFLQPRTIQARVYLLQGLIAGLYSTTAVFLHQPDRPLLTNVYLVLECLFPATWINFALVFPVSRALTGWRRSWVLVPYAFSGLLAALVLHGFYQHPPELGALHVVYLYTASSIILFVVTMALSYRENREPLARLRIQIVLPGIFVATALACFAFTENAWSGRQFPIQYGLLLTPIGYGSLAYAIAKHDLFDIDRVVRQSFTYAVLSVIVIAAYAGVMMLPTGLLDDRGHHHVLTVVFVLVLAFALDPLRRGVQSVVDRAFYRARLDYPQTISELSAVMTTLLNLREVVDQVTRVVVDAMHLERIAVCLLMGDDGPSLWLRGPQRPLERQPVDQTVETLVVTSDRFADDFQASAVLAHIEPEIVRQQAARFLARLGIGIALPLSVRGRALGALLLGPKRSGRRFTYEDIDLLRTLANQTAIAVENALSYEALEASTRDLDEKVRTRTGELRESNQRLERAYVDLRDAQAQLVQSEKMAAIGQLVAGVAHELNNPASFIHGGLANLREFLTTVIEIMRAYEQAPIADAAMAAELDDLRQRTHLDYLLRETPELLRICLEGSDRIKRIIDDLRVFVRADQGERGPTDLRAGVESTLRLLTNRLSTGRVHVDTRFEPVPMIRANAGQLNQVWMNLLANAIDAVESRPHPEIRVAIRAGGAAASGIGENGRNPHSVTVEIGDNGAGIKPSDRERIFEPFFTTKPIGRGTGLGLSIVYGAVKSHGGTIGVETDVGRGTIVRVTLPVRADSA